ncbi:hypothetical protein ACN9MN_02995 [Chryseobacterium sp. S-02]|uniref:hypothetical protein n=1 Tax=Chryseobacterium sp. S-02 TaxID=3404064 RepID=UPI003CEF8E77
MENNNLPKIYSKGTILGFSIFLSTLFGGVLLYQNLIDDKKKKEGYIVLGVSILLTIITIIIGSFLENPKSSLGFISGFLGGNILSNYFVPKYFPNEEQYPKKQIWKPLIIGFIIFVILMALIIYGRSLENS